MSVPVPSPDERRPPSRIGRRERVGFLELIASGYSVTSAAKTVGRHRRSFEKVRARDAAFAAAWAEAWESGNDAIRDAIRVRALDGHEERTERIRADGTVDVTIVRKLDGRALELAAKMRLPELRELGSRVHVGVAVTASASTHEDRSAPISEVYAVLRELGQDETAAALATRVSPEQRAELLALTDEQLRELVALPGNQDERARLALPPGPTSDEGDQA